LERNFKKGVLILDKVDEIYDELDNFLGNYFGSVLTKQALENLSINICGVFGICEKCGAKFKGERNE
jgi:hypothetical protein